MRLDFPENDRMRISFKTIYRWLEQGVKIKKSHPWRGYSRYLRLKRKGKTFSRDVSETRGRRGDLPSIEDRPKAANQRSRFGDWEGDLIRGFRGQGYLLTLVERSLGLLLAQPCPNKSPDSVNRAILSAFKGFPLEWIRTIAVDRGKEFYGYEQLQKKLKTKVFFCHPHSPNERGQNEQINGLLRQFFPKRKPLSGVSKEKIQWAVALINNRPKKKFGYRTTRELIKQRGLYDVLTFA
jgi:IS30 family transposase